MKMIEAIIKPFKLEEVKATLNQIGIRGITISEIKGFGRQRGHKVSYRGSEYTTDFVAKLMVQTAVPDSLVQAVVDGILRAARTGEIGDGKIFVKNLESVTRIRTGEKGESAI
jgi:nitrogen regulatory protein P-II 2